MLTSSELNNLNALVEKLSEMGGSTLKLAIQERLYCKGETFTNLTLQTNVETRRIVLGIPTQIVHLKLTANGGVEFTLTGGLSGTFSVLTVGVAATGHRLRSENRRFRGAMVR